MISCPKCKGTIFQTGLHMCKQANVDIVDGNITVTPVEGVEDSSLIQCVGCKEKFDMNDKQIIHILTHPLVKCSECGKEFTSEELDENGVCTICRVKKMDKGFADIENADPFTVIRMLAQARITNYELSQKNESIQKELERAEEIHQNEDSEEEAPKKKRASRKKKVEEPTEEEVINVDEENTQTDSDIEISEDVAPDLPEEVTDMSKAMNPPVEE